MVTNLGISPRRASATTPTVPVVPTTTHCPIAKMMRLAALMSRRWTLLMLKSLCDGHSTFSAIRRQYPSLSARVLAERLRELVTAGYVVRTTGRTHLDVRYALSSKGKAFGQWIRALERWLNEWEK